MFGQVWVRKIADFGLDWGKSFGKRSAHTHPIFLGVAFPQGNNSYGMSCLITLVISFCLERLM